MRELLEAALRADRVELVAWILDDLRFPLESRIGSYFGNTDTPLLSACNELAPRCLALLVERGADVHALNSDGASALTLLCGNSDVPASAVSSLLKAGLDANNRTSRGRTPLLQLASGFGNGDAIQVLLAAGARLDAVDSDNCDALMLARCSFTLRRLVALVDDAFLLKSAERATDGDSLLKAALLARPADVPLVEQLLQRVPLLREQFKTLRYRDLQLVAVVAGDQSDAAMLRLARAHSDAGLSTTWLALEAALAGGELANAKLLVDGADAERVDALLRHEEPEHDSLLEAVLGSSLDAFRWLLALDARSVLDVRKANRRGVTPFVAACSVWRTTQDKLGRDGMLEILRTLKARGADVNAVDDSGQNAFLNAAYRGAAPFLLELLLGEFGFKLDARDNDQQTALHLCNTADTMTFLLARGGLDVNARDSREKTPLLSYPGTYETVALLLDAGADVGAVDVDGDSLLHNGLQRLEALALLKRSGIERAFVANKRGDTPLHTVSYAPGLKALLAAPFVKPSDIDARREDGMTPWLAAIDSGDLDRARLLRARGADVHARAKDGRNAMHLAMASESDALVRELLAAGVDASAVDNEGKTPLSHLRLRTDHTMRLLKLVKSEPRLGGAAAIGRLCDSDGTLLHRAFDSPDIVHELVACGVDVNALSKGWRPKTAVFEHCDSLPLIKAFHAVGANMSATLENGSSLLLAAAAERSVTAETLFFLVDVCGLSLTHINDEGENVLHQLVKGERGVAVLRALRAQYGAQLPPLDVPTKNGRNVLHVAADAGSLATCQYLLEALGDAAAAALEARTDDGDTVLHLALKSYSTTLSLVQLLVERGVAIDAANNEGETPVMLAAAHSSGKIFMPFLLARMPGGATAQLNVVDDDGCSALFRALNDGAKPAQLDALRAAGASVDAAVKSNNGRTLLHAAAYSTDHATIKWMLAADPSNANINAADDDGLTPLSTLLGRSRAHENVVGAVQLLVDAGASLQVTNADGESILVVAADAGCLSVGLVAYLASNGVDFAARCNSGRNALYGAVRRSADAAVLAALVKGGCDPVLVDANEQLSLLHAAADQGEMKAAVYALNELKLDPNAVDVKQRTPLHAAMGAYMEADVRVEFFELLHARTDLKRRDTDNKSLVAVAVAASGKVSPALVTRLLDALGTGVAESENELLGAAASSGRADLVRLFVERGAQVNAPIKDRWNDSTPLLTAVAVYDADEALAVATVLLDAGASPNLASKDDQDTPLHKARHVALIDLLVARGADPSLKNKAGQLPLHAAAADRDLAEFAALLKHTVAKGGVDLNLLDKEGNSPLVLAAESRDDALEKVTALLDAGASPRIVDRRGALRTDFRTSVEILQLLSERNPSLKK